MPTPAGGNAFPFLDGPLSMEKRVFDVARDLVDHPQAPRHKLPIKIYMACMVIEYLERKIEAEAKGLGPGAYFICPECRNQMAYDSQLDCYSCVPCVTSVAIHTLRSMFNPGIYMPSQTNTKPPDPKDYDPRLTSPLPTGMDIEELEKLEKIKTAATQEEEPIVMYRSWKLVMPWGSGLHSDDEHVNDATGRHLKSINAVVWEPRHPLRAVHYPGGSTHDDKGGCPNWNCNCGIYAVKTLRQAQQWGRVGKPAGDGTVSSVQVLGKVVLWGKVLMFETGAKAQYAYPQELWISPTMLEWADQEHPERIANELSAAYGIPVNVEDGMFDLGLSHT